MAISAEEKIKEICAAGISGKLTVDAFYDKLRTVADDDRTDGDTSCILEDVLCDLEMEHDRSGSKKAMAALIKEAAEQILEEINNL